MWRDSADMNSKFILDLIIMISLSGVLFLIARTLPKINDRDISTSRSDTPIMLIYLEKMDESIRSGTEKFLRRFRVSVLKLDNFVSRKIDNYKKEVKDESDILDVKDED